MLTRQQRIAKNLFPLLKKNKVYEGEVFSLRVTFLEAGGPKAVCIVSKKIAPRANVRNKVKRQVYSILFPILKGSNKAVAVQIFPKKIILTKKYSETECDLKKILADNKIF